ncbi:MAG: flagellar protein FlaG [Persephonella sp.]|nr:flagellar protein FlaG [Persephonella sp.]
MDVKAITGTQAGINMNAQNVDALDKTQMQKLQTQKQAQKEQLQAENIKDVPQEVIKQAVENLNKKLDMLNSQLKVEFDKDTGIKVIKIVDKDTKEVIRQIPPEVILKIAKYLDEVTGLLFSEKV